MAAAAVCASLAMFADRREARPPVFYVLKPLTTVLIIAFAAVREPASADYRQWILVALVLSLLGDIALMFHGERWFLAGLGSFLVAHLAFVAAFTTGVEEFRLPWWIAASPVAGFVLLPLLWRGAGVLRPAVLVYGLVLCAMVLTAAARYQALPAASALCALAGAVLFQLSDSLLGYRQFVRPYPAAQPLILSTYWLAIGLVAASI